MKHLSLCIFVLHCSVSIVSGQTEITGGGAKGYLAKFTSRTTVGNSNVFQTPTGDVGVGNATAFGRNVPGFRRWGTNRCG